MKAFSLKSIVKASPQLYDLYLRERHRFSEETDPLCEMLERFSQARGGAVRFVAAGAGNGLDNDPLREFILREDWRGVMVEPEPLLFRSLMRNYPARRFPHIRLVPAALSTRDDEGLVLHAVRPESLAQIEPEHRTKLLALASLDRDRLLSGLSAQGLGPDSILPRETQPVTLMRLAREFFVDRHFDLLLLDAGGHEAAILGSLDFEMLRPDAILILDGESLGGSKDPLTRKLVRAGYAVRPLGAALLASLV
jgi:Methyltransferase FkbM domain